MSKDLSLKTVKILVFAKIKKCSDLQILRNKYMALGENKMIFKMEKKTKNLKKGSIPPPVEYKAIGGILCPITTTRSYIDRTKPWREANKATRFFLGYIQPHKPITSSTKGRWL